MKDLLFLIVIFLANTIQGVTGFAGTILALPFSITLVGYDTAIPILNMLGILAGVYVLVLYHQYVDWKEVGRIVSVMTVMIIAGSLIKEKMAAYDKVLYILLGCLVLVIAVKGLVKLVQEERAIKLASTKGKAESQGGQHKLVESNESGMRDKCISIGLLILSGLIHGMFVSGGPLLISYLSKRLKDKNVFRATISTVWIFMNGLLFVLHFKQGMWTADVVKTQLLAIPFLIGGMALGSVLYKRMSQKLFLVLTYVLLIIAAITLFFK